MDKIVRQFEGHSGSDIFLMQDGTSFFVRKTKNIERNYERLVSLATNSVPVPKIFSKHEDVIDMEYIRGIDIATLLSYSDPADLIDFCTTIFDKFQKTGCDVNYRHTYETHVTVPDVLSFTKDELIEKLPWIMPQSLYHGDFTLDNIIATEGGFYLIDGITTVYDSFGFDLAKLRQDLTCGWFTRNKPEYNNPAFQAKLNYVSKCIGARYPLFNDDYLLIAMLLRVLNYTKPNSKDYRFLIKWIEKLWK